jgi:hypothetical protein
MCYDVLLYILAYLFTLGNVFLYTLYNQMYRLNIQIPNYLFAAFQFINFQPLHRK